MTIEEFIEKMESEGAHYAFTDYGLSESDLDPDVPEEFREAVRQAVNAYQDAEALTHRIYALAP
jgi:hypothetical protein